MHMSSLLLTEICLVTPSKHYSNQLFKTSPISVIKLLLEHKSLFEVKFLLLKCFKAITIFKKFLIKTPKFSNWLIVFVFRLGTIP